MAKTNRRSKIARHTISSICRNLEAIAPLHLAQSWDNVGLLTGDESRAVKNVLLCIDLTPEVAVEAIRCKVGLVMAYHPPVFKPITRLTAESSGPEAALFSCIENKIGVYSMHTALDAADGGTCDVIAEMCDIPNPKPMEYTQGGGVQQFKIVVFVPEATADTVAAAMAEAGAGVIGNYTNCSFRIMGTGTFKGSSASNPTIGKPGSYERVSEVRLEMLCPEARLPHVCQTMLSAHPYEEPAYDIHPLHPAPERGFGRCGKLARPTSLIALARRLKRLTVANCVQIIGTPDREIDRAIILVGAAGSSVLKGSLTRSTAIITGEIRHHDALTMKRRGCSAIALNHWTSERPVLAVLKRRLCELAPGIEVAISEADCEPFVPVR